LVREAHFRAVNEANPRNQRRGEYRNLCVRKVEIIHVNTRDDRDQDEYTARISAHARLLATQAGAIVHRDEFVKAWVEFRTFHRAEKSWYLSEILPRDAAVVLFEGTRPLTRLTAAARATASRG